MGVCDYRNYAISAGTNRRFQRKFAAYSGEKLADKFGVIGGQNAISEAIKILRDTVVDELASTGISCGR